jgi:predicted acetyltransferase
MTSDPGIATTTERPTSTWTVRHADADSWPDIRQVDEFAFGYTWDDATGVDERAVLELDRSLLVYDGETPVGLAMAHSLSLSVPTGREVPVAGVTWVGVVPTHRRRGVLTALMKEQIADVHRRGEPVAALFASESGIYGRFGYGRVNDFYSLEVKRGHGELNGPVDPALRVRLTDPADARAAVDQVYSAVRSVRAAVPARDELWWKRCITDPPSERGQSSALRVAVVEDDASARAYAIFSSKHKWVDGSGENEIAVRESLSVDGAAATALWSMLFSVDLTAEVRVNVATDDVLLHILTDLRRAQPRLRDGLYARLVDLPTALAARTYDRAWDGVLEITDAIAPWNAGRWQVSLGPEGATCARTDLAPDLAMDVSELGGAYFGGVSLLPRAEAGRVIERRPGAMSGLSGALVHEPGPYCTYSF